MFREFSENSKSDEFLNEFRQKMADQTASNIEERQQEMRRSKSVFVGTLAGLVLAGVVGGFILSPHYKGLDEYNIPVIKRSPNAVKTAPKDRGGMQVENQDKSVYEILENKEETEVVVEKVLPAPEEPKLPTITVNEKIPESIDEAIDNAIDTVEDSVIPEEKTITLAEAQEKIEAETAQPIAEAEKKVEEVQTAVAEVKTVVEEKLVPAQPVVVEKPAPAQPAAAEKAAPKAIAGDWQIQIMSSPNKGAIEKSWTTLAEKHSFLANVSHEIEEVDLPDKGTFYRLYAGAFAEKAQADELCNKLKAAGGSCFAKKK